MPINEDPPATVQDETPAPTDVTRHMATAALKGITVAQHYVTRAIQDVIKPAIKSFLEICDTNPRIAAVVATPALLGFLVVLAILTVTTTVLIIWTILTITLGIIFVIVAGIVSLFFKLFVVVLATIPLAGIGIGLLIGANAASQSIIKRIRRNGVGLAIRQTFKDTDWKAVMEHLVDLGKNLGPGLLILRVALYDCFIAFKRGMEDVHNARVERRRTDSPSNPTAETTGEPNQENIHQTPSELPDVELRDHEPESTELAEGLKRRAPFPQTFDSEE